MTTPLHYDGCIIMRRTVVRAFVAVTAALFVLAAAGGLWVRAELRGSLAHLDATLQVSGLSEPVTVTRDALGIPTIEGASREDVARATGFVHGQDRFFQMDLARRRAAGELAALVGTAAVAADRQLRVHRFRAIARRGMALMSAPDRKLLDAYAAGVNAGLAALDAVPPEYLLLRQPPQPWRPEDSLLIVLSMFVTLQDTRGAYEATLATMHEVLPPEMFDFLAPQRTEWDSPIVGEPSEPGAAPGPEVYNLRARRMGRSTVELPDAPRTLAHGPSPPDCHDSQFPHRPGLSRALRAVLHVADAFLTCRQGEEPGLELRVPEHDRIALGSNNWAIAGPLTEDGGALVANDMHLPVRVPNIWYRVLLEWPDPDAPTGRRRLSGVTLPGLPALVAGSNTHVAWGFTNTYSDWSDIVLLEIDPEHPNRYRTPDGWREIELIDEVIEIAGESDQHVTVAWTMWGPRMPDDYRGRARAYRWVAHDAERLAAAIMPIENARTLEDAFDSANGIGVPGQNIVAADSTGRIGWSIYGALPRRVGLDGRLPSSWADGTRGWAGWRERNEYPRILDPAKGRIWTANARVVDGDMLAALGDGNYEVGSRARIVRERLMAKDRFTPRDLLEVQLDTSAHFLSRWRELLLSVLDARAAAGSPARAHLRDIVDRDWSGHALPDSAAYRLTRMFREDVSDRIAAFVLAECYEADPSFDYGSIRQRESPIWVLVRDKPLHLLDPRYEDWNELLLAAIDSVIEQAMAGRDGDLSARVWSEYNVAAYRHPLSSVLPLGGRWLDMPLHPLPGDLFTPRVHWGIVAASVRMVVSPGRETNGILHMPTGQSGHPLSPFYRNSHPAWLASEPTPFLPGPGMHVLTLVP
jgi:penicillin G amidase